MYNLDLPGQGDLGERGVIIAQTPAAFKHAVLAALAQCEVNMRSTFDAILIELKHIRVVKERSARINQWIAALMKNSALCRCGINYRDGDGRGYRRH